MLGSEAVVGFVDEFALGLGVLDFFEFLYALVVFDASSFHFGEFVAL